MARTKQFEKELVLENAMNLFWKKGFHATSLSDLVKELGINRASLYDTFENKEQLFQQSLNLYSSQKEKQFADFLYYQTNVRQGLFLLFESMLDASGSDQRKGCLVVNTITELASSNQQLKEICYQYKLAIEKVYFNYLQYGVNQGQLSPYKEISTIAAYLYSLQNGLMVDSEIQDDKSVLLQTVSTGLTVLD